LPADENSQHWTRLDHPLKVEIAGSNPARVTSKLRTKPEHKFGGLFAFESAEYK